MSADYTHDQDYRSPSSQALRDAGYKRCPRWWLTDEQLELVAYLAHQNEAEVKRIRETATRNRQDWRLG